MTTTKMTKETENFVRTTFADSQGITIRYKLKGFWSQDSISLSVRPKSVMFDCTGDVETSINWGSGGTSSTCPTEISASLMDGFADVNALLNGSEDNYLQKLTDEVLELARLKEEQYEARRKEKAAAYEKMLTKCVSLGELTIKSKLRDIMKSVKINEIESGTINIVYLSKNTGELETKPINVKFKNGRILTNFKGNLSQKVFIEEFMTNVYVVDFTLTTNN